MGRPTPLAAALLLREVSPFGESEIEGTPAVGRVGRFEGTLDALDARVADAFGANGLRVSGDRDRPIERVAVVPGSGSSLIDAAAEVADALVTGDVSHHRAVHALDLGLAIVDPGHIATERPGMAALVALVTDVVDVPVTDLTGIDPETWG